jgi:hypothetical protein
VALLETVFHEVHSGGRRVVSRAIDLAGWGLIELAPLEPLRLIDLSDDALVRLGLTEPDGSAARQRLVSTSAGHYPCTREWSARLHARGRVGRSLPVGIGWRSRVAELAAADAVLLDDLLAGQSATAFVLFGDRVSTDLGDWSVRRHLSDLADPAALALVLAVADQLRATVEGL